MRTVNTQQAKTQLSALLAEVAATGDRIVICRDGQPVADLVPHRRRLRSTPDPVLAGLAIHYDPVAPLGEDEWPQTP